jgi:hypothetical protein
VTAGLGVGVNGGNESTTDTFFASGFLGKGAGIGAVFLAGKAAFTGGLATVAALATGFTGADLTGTDFAGRDLTGTDGLAGAALGNCLYRNSFFCRGSLHRCRLSWCFLFSNRGRFSYRFSSLPRFLHGFSRYSLFNWCSLFCRALVAFFAAFTGFEATFAFFLVAIYRN